MSGLVDFIGGEDASLTVHPVSGGTKAGFLAIAAMAALTLSSAAEASSTYVRSVGSAHVSHVSDRFYASGAIEGLYSSDPSFGISFDASSADLCAAIGRERADTAFASGNVRSVTVGCADASGNSVGRLKLMAGGETQLAEGVFASMANSPAPKETSDSSSSVVRMLLLLASAMAIGGVAVASVAAIRR